jgi:hypothetical protein
MKVSFQIAVALTVAGAAALSSQPLHPAAKRGAPRSAPAKNMPKPAIPPKAGAGRLSAPNGAVERLLAMSPEQRERVLEKLPPSQQDKLRKRFEQFDARPPEEKARLLGMWKKLESMPPEKRELLTRQMQAFNALPDDRRVVLRRALNQLGRLSPEDREARLASESFRGGFSAPELQMLTDLAQNYPFPDR